MSTIQHPAPLGVDHLEAFLRGQTGCSRSALKSRRNVVRTFLRDTPDFLAATEADVETWLDGKHLATSTRNTYRGCVRVFYTWARENGLTSVEIRPRGGPGTAKTVSPEGLTGLVFLIVPRSWQTALDAWVLFMRAAGRPATTLYLREYQLRRFAADTFLEPFEVTGADLVGWVAIHKWAPESRRSYRSALRSFYGWAYSSGNMGHNPAELLPSVALPIRSPRPAPEEVLGAALEAADDRVRLMLLLAARLGLRRGEIATVHTEDIVTSPLGWSLRVTGKGRRQRVLPLAGELKRLLAACPPGFVFPGGVDGHLSPAWVGKMVSAILGPLWTTHTLRHRFATAAYAGQRDLFAVQTLLGHSRPETTMGYVALPDESLRAAVASAS